MPRWSMAVAGAALSIGCTEYDILFLPYPDTAGFESMVLAVDGRSSQQLVAIDLSLGSFPIQLAETIGPSEPWRAHALLLREDLVTLTLKPGPLTPAADADPYPIRVEPDRYLTRNSEDEALAAWREPANLEARFHPLRVKNEDPFSFCPRVEVSQTELPNARSAVRILFPLDEERMLVVTSRRREDGTIQEEQRLFIAVIRGERVEADELPIPPEPLLLASAKDQDGRTWIADETGALYGLDVQERAVNLQLIAPGPTTQNIDPYWLHVGPEVVVVVGGNGLVYGATRTSSVNVEWNPQPLHDFGSGTGRNLTAGGLLVRSPQEMWIGKGSTRQIVRLRHQAGVFAPPEIEDGLASEPAIGVSALAEVPGLGILAGMTDGEIRRYLPATGTWDSLGPTRFTQVALSIVPTQDGFLMAGGTGLFNFYVDPHGYCPLDAAGYDGLRAPGTVRVVEPFGSNAYLMGSSPLANSTQALVWLKRRP